MGMLLINILSLFLLLNFKFADTIECYTETDITKRTGEILKDGISTCDTVQLSEILKVPVKKCFKSDCGKCCGACVGVELLNIGLGFKEGDCTCYNCDDDKCNSAIDVLWNFKIIILFCLTIMIINGK
uniref:Uncharacterized protein n=1 Tax=Meloidogyne enterolobii TaxID=390850 RepID=A0A6V7XHD4_MELEN|nr:unnamed protein product [Meloidogyne enterolobii]